MVDFIPLIAIPLPILVHWTWVEVRYKRDGALPRYGSAGWARMSAVERVCLLSSTLGLFAYVVVVANRGDQPNALAAAALVFYAARLAIDFYARLRYPRNTGKR